MLTHWREVIFGHCFDSPRVAAETEWQHDSTEDQFPKLKRVSDILTAFWLRGHSNPKNLRYYLIFQVQNVETTPLIARILRDANLNQVPYWPGLVVGIWEKAGGALLGSNSLIETCDVLQARLTYSGSPLGSTLAFLLAQHKAELGHKHVTEVTIFRENHSQDTVPQIQLLFTVKDVHGSEAGEDENGDLNARHDRAGPRNIVRTHMFDALYGRIITDGA
jgi:hypothetical protein